MLLIDTSCFPRLALRRDTYPCDIPERVIIPQGYQDHHVEVADSTILNEAVEHEADSDPGSDRGEALST